MNWYLLSVITSLLCAPIGEGSLFYSPQELGCVWYEKISNKAVPGISSPLCSGSQLFLADKENVLCVRPWHSHNINSLSSRLLSTPSHCYCCISFPSTLKWQCWILTLTPSLSRASAEPNLQIRVSHLLPQYFGDAEHNRGEVYAHIILVFCAASELSFTRRTDCLSVLSIRNAWPRFSILVYISFH